MAVVVGGLILGCVVSLQPHGGLRAAHAVEVRLPAGCDLDAARRDLRQRLPSADLQVHRWSPDGVELTLDLPAETAWKEMDGWARSAPQGGGARRD